MAEFLDAYAGLDQQVQSYHMAWTDSKMADKALMELEAEFGAGFDADYTQFMWEEVSQANLREDEEETLREELTWLSNMEAIQWTYREARAGLEEAGGAPRAIGRL